MFLAGDIGGTNCRLIACDSQGRLGAQQVFPSSAYTRFTDVVLEFIARTGQRYLAACFGLPGPVIDQCCKLTNLAWTVDGRDLAAETGIGSVLLVNDLQANAYGIEGLAADCLATINSGIPVDGGTLAVVSPGTGLGEAALVYVQGQALAIASEGGHADFGPMNDLEIDLVRYMQRSYRCVTYELLLSGPGLRRIYDFLGERDDRPTPQWLLQRMAAGDPAAAISAAALERRDRRCEQALDLFVSILAAEASNAALKFLAVGGVYLGGGIPPKILPRLREPFFMSRFASKEKMAGLLSGIPIHVILDDRAALQGALLQAARMVSRSAPSVFAFQNSHSELGSSCVSDGSGQQGREHGLERPPTALADVVSELK